MPAASKFRPEFVEQAQKLCELGATDLELAQFFHVDKKTLYLWRVQHPELGAAMKAGKEPVDDRVERSLLERATGYDFDSEEIFCKDGVVTRVPVVKHVPPDVTAQIFWLKNRRPEIYREVNRHDVTSSDGSLSGLFAEAMQRATPTPAVKGNGHG